MDKEFIDSEYRKICSEKTLQTNSKGFFLDFVGIISKSVGENWIRNTFGNLNTDKERIREIFNCEEIRSPLLSILANIQEVYRKKDTKLAELKRNEADTFFQKDDFKKSLALYSQSIIRTPETVNNSENILPVTLLKRSQVLMSLQEYSLAISDIQYAIKNELSDNFKAEAYWKLAVCFKALNEEKKAHVSFNIAEKLLGNSKELEDLKKDRDSVIISKRSKQTKVYPDIFTSQKISIKYESGKGRYASAREYIQTGETLVVEKPYAACLLPEMFGTHCHHCFERLVAPVGCTVCSNVAFCTLTCRDSAINSYHKFECKYLDLLIGSGMSILAHVALRMITQNNFEDSLKMYMDKKKNHIYSLCTNFEGRPAEDFLQRTLMAAFLLACLKKCGYFGHSSNEVLPTEKEQNIGELILFHLQMLQFNAHEIYETRVIQNDMKRSRIVYIGVGIYPTVALFNHDCYPGVTRHFVGKNIVIRAARPLQQGEAISENYGPIFTRRNLKERQRSLSSRYWFICKCNACVFNWPTYADGLDNYSKKLKCTTRGCNYYFTLPAKNDTIKCPKCNEDIKSSPQQHLLEWCETQYDIAFTKLTENQPQEAIAILCEAIDVFHRISCPPHKKTHLAQETLQVCMSALGNIFEIPT